MEDLVERGLDADDLRLHDDELILKTRDASIEREVRHWIVVREGDRLE
jgi:hypothetical protein